MNKADFIAKVAEKSEVTKAQAGRTIDATLDTLKELLKEGDSIQFVGFGKFAVKERAARTGRNPKTGEAIQIAAAKAPVFKAGTELKKTLNS